MTIFSRAVVAIAATVATLAAGGLITAAGQEPAERLAMEIRAMSATTDVSELRRLDALVDAMARTDELVPASRQADRHMLGRVHESFMQYHQGVPVHGGGVSRQLSEGVTVSIFGTIHQGIDLDTTPGLSPYDALTLLERQVAAGLATADPPALVIFPTVLGEYVLAYRATMRDRHTWFVDAHSGVIVHSESEVDEQSAVGVGAGIQGQRKKVSSSLAGGSFQAYDRLRPAEIVTLDLRYDEVRADRLIGTPEMMGVPWRPSDVASDADNEWDDPAVVDGATADPGRVARGRRLGRRTGRVGEATGRTRSRGTPTARRLSGRTRRYRSAPATSRTPAAAAGARQRQYRGAAHRAEDSPAAGATPG